MRILTSCLALFLAIICTPSAMAAPPTPGMTAAYSAADTLLDQADRMRRSIGLDALNRRPFDQNKVDQTLRLRTQAYSQLSIACDQRDAKACEEIAFGMIPLPAKLAPHDPYPTIPHSVRTSAMRKAFGAYEELCTLNINAQKNCPMLADILDTALKTWPRAQYPSLVPVYAELATRGGSGLERRCRASYAKPDTGSDDEFFGCYDAVELYDKGNANAAANLRSFLCDNNDREACSKLGRKSPSEISEQARLTKLPTLCSSGDKRACNQILIKYIQEKNLVEARTWADKGCLQSIDFSCEILARLQYTGEGGSKDVKAALLNADKACRLYPAGPGRKEMACKMAAAMRTQPATAAPKN